MVHEYRDLVCIASQALALSHAALHLRRTISEPSYSRSLKGKRPRSIHSCLVLYPRRHPSRFEEKARAIALFVAFQAGTKPYGMKNCTLRSLKVYCFGLQVHEMRNLAGPLVALTIYPPMGRQRIRPVHDGGASHTSLGRCQLIQQYLMQKTGKNRTRKQISSRIQRLRHMHQDDPASTLVSDS